MKVTEEGLALIRRFEGFRSEAYRDAVGVWTIGYGHTSMAGPPKVTAGLRISAEEGAAILARDVEHFAAGVAQLVKVPISDTQFSALVSFAYNVGLGAFRASSVLKAVNEGDFPAVPHRLGLWVRAGGKTLPGLVKRRAMEGELFASRPAPPADTPAPPRPLPPTPAPPPQTEPRRSWGAALLALLHVTWNLILNHKKEGR
ncbi:MAG: lysozyme [Rhizobiales bacterium]|nr:lysozyme [Hyphomicrobiales bacterium]